MLDKLLSALDDTPASRERHHEAEDDLTDASSEGLEGVIDHPPHRTQMRGPVRSSNRNMIAPQQRCQCSGRDGDEEEEEKEDEGHG